MDSDFDDLRARGLKGEERTPETFLKFAGTPKEKRAANGKTWKEMNMKNCYEFLKI